MDSSSQRSDRPPGQGDKSNQGKALKALLSFTAPLASVIFLQLVARQFILGGLSSQAESQGGRTEVELAAFVVAFALMLLTASPVQNLQILFLGYDEPTSRGRLFSFSLLLTALGTVAALVLAFTPVGFWLIHEVQGLSPELTERVQFALRPLVIWPPMAAVMTACSGILKRRAESFSLAIVNVLGIAVTLSVIFAGPSLGWPALYLAAAAFLSGQMLRVLLLLWMVLREPAVDTPLAEAPPPPCWNELSSFYWPLLANTVLMLGTRPLLQWFLAREPDPEMTLAAFGVALAAGQVFYGWLNELRNHAVAFRNQPEILAQLGRFNLILCVSTTGLMVALFWTPLGASLLERWMHLPAEIVQAARPALAVTSLLPLAVAGRAYYQGLAVYDKRTKSWFTSGLMRVAMVVLVMLACPFFGINGATLGAVGLLSCFIAETASLAWMLRRSRKRFVLQAAAGTGD